MIQIDMQMPKCCDECFALDEHGDYPFCLISQDQRGYTFNTHEKRMPTCPLKAQEPVEPQHLHDKSRLPLKCGNCGAFIIIIERPFGMGDYKAKFCCECGQAVKWE